MSGPNAIRKVLLADANVYALIGGATAGRVYPVRAPQAPELPFLVVTQIAATRVEHQPGTPAGLLEAVVQVDIFDEDTESASGVDDARALAALVRQALDGYQGTVSPYVIQGILIDGEFEQWEEAVELYRVVQTYRVWLEETP